MIMMGKSFRQIWVKRQYCASTAKMVMKGGGVIVSKTFNSVSIDHRYCLPLEIIYLYPAQSNALDTLVFHSYLVV